MFHKPDPTLYSFFDPTLELASLFKLQLDRLEADLRVSVSVHASGPRKPNLSQLEAIFKPKS